MISPELFCSSDDESDESVSCLAAAAAAKAFGIEDKRGAAGRLLRAGFKVLQKAHLKDIYSKSSLVAMPLKK